MFRICAITMALSVVLGGCAVGINGAGSPKADFRVNRDYASAYDAAQAQAQACLRGPGSYAVKGDLDRASGHAEINVTAPFSDNPVARIQISAAGADHADVHVAMWGKGTWDAIAVDAMRDAIIYGVPSCVSFMPGAPAPHR